MKIIYVPPDEKITTFIRRRQRQKNWYQKIRPGQWFAAGGVCVALIIAALKFFGVF